ncbi:MAG: HEAT repeat domain-containing protein [Methanoregulaceae archaeon]|nr:HEAT repeat domain-containing protein [Methanoregulaceae archaeon]
MPSLPFSIGKKPDVGRLEREQDISELIRLLAHRDVTIQWKAASALERLRGATTTKKLIAALNHPDRRMRIGVVEILSDLRDIQAVPGLLLLLSRDDSNEVRWASAIALGEIGDPAARAGLVKALKDPDKYVRYGAAIALEKNGWIPEDPEGQVYFLVSAQRWNDIPGLEEVPVGPLIHSLSDYDPAVRAHVVKILGDLHDPAAKGACDLALRDISGTVRWEALMAFPKCNIPLMHLPRGLARRKKQRSPYAAMILNFFCLGLGYNYLGMWWGFLVFQVNVTCILTMSLFIPSYTAYLISWAISTPFALHTLYYVRGMPDP